ncbi:MAG: alpha/beta fold hydrolase [Anaerolineaceae bacterium]|nr:alpha/beta fold hydrolase [Anaerolineaceae bacterium]
MFVSDSAQGYTLPMPTITLPHTTLYYAPFLPTDARQTLVLIHGAGSSHLTWPSALRRLPQTAVYALDLAGHGRSAPSGRQTTADYAQDVIQFIEALELEDVVILGHSMGGAIAQQIALAPPPGVVALVLLGTGARLRVAPAFTEGIQADFSATVDLLNQFYWGALPNPDLLAANRRSMLACAPQVMLADFLACDSFDLRDRLSEISLPALVVSGGQDQMTPAKFGQFLAEQLPRAEFALIEEAGHMMMLEFPERVAELVQGFLAKLQGE